MSASVFKLLLILDSGRDAHERLDFKWVLQGMLSLVNNDTIKQVCHLGRIGSFFSACMSHKNSLGVGVGVQYV